MCDHRQFWHQQWGLIVGDNIWHNYKWAFGITLNWLGTVLTIQFLVDLKQTPAKQRNRGCPSREWCWCLSATMTNSRTDIVFRDFKSAQCSVSFHQNQTRRVANYQSISWGLLHIYVYYICIYIYNMCVYVWSIIQQNQQGKSCCFWKLEACWAPGIATLGSPGPIGAATHAWGGLQLGVIKTGLPIVDQKKCNPQCIG